MDVKKNLRKSNRQLRGLSFQQRLPLLICILLLSVMFIFGCISYLEVRNAAVKTAQGRLVALSQQLSNLLAQSSQSFLTSTRSLAGQEHIKKTFSTTATNTDSALFVLQKFQQQDSSSFLIELLSAAREPILHSGIRGYSKEAVLDKLIPSLPFGQVTGSISKIYLVGDSMYYAVVMPVTDKKQLTGFLIRWRHLVANQQTVDQLSQLMGSNASFFIGNTDGSLWTDMMRPLAHPAPDTSKFSVPIEYKNHEGNRTLAAMKSIAATPWLVSVEFSRDLVLEPAHVFLRWMIVLGGVLTAIGIVIAWIMSRNITQPLKQLTAAASGIANGDYSRIVGVDRRDEIGKLARSFNAMIAQLSLARGNLEQKVTETEQMNEQLRSLTAHLQNIREDERIHIAREMHDELGQLLTSFKMDVSWINKNLPDSTKPAVSEKLAIMTSLIDESVSFVRKLAAELRPSILDDFGLIPALHWHSKEFEKRFSITVELETEEEKLELPAQVATGLFRIYQESLTNVARHAGAKKVNACLSVTGGILTLSIKDDGKGFDHLATGNSKTLGLLGMGERAAMIGGKLDILSSKGKGTTITITRPLQLKEDLLTTKV